MRWYVSRNGESSGPHEETTVAEWARANQLDGAMLRDEAASAWVPVSQTPFLALVRAAALSGPSAVPADSPVPTPVAQKPPSARRVFALFGILGVLMFFYFVVTAGDGPHSASAFPWDSARVAVECIGTGAGYQCTLAHTQGSAAAKACWDLAIACHNGTKASASACQTVEPGGKATAFIPLADISNAAACDVVTTVNVQNMRVLAP